MAYSLNLLTTRAQCDAVLAYAQAKLSLLTYHDTQTGRRADNLATSAGDLASELTSRNPYLMALTPGPPGPAGPRGAGRGRARHRPR